MIFTALHLLAQDLMIVITVDIVNSSLNRCSNSSSSNPLNHSSRKTCLIDPMPSSLLMPLHPIRTVTYPLNTPTSNCNPRKILITGAFSHLILSSRADPGIEPHNISASCRSINNRIMALLSAVVQILGRWVRRYPPRRRSGRWIYQRKMLGTSRHHRHRRPRRVSHRCIRIVRPCSDKADRVNLSLRYCSRICTVETAG